jgi:hypothetical protein
MLLNIKLAFK